MKKLFIFLLIFSLLFLTSCTDTDDASEPFSSDFEITHRDTSPTSVIINPDYIGETKVFDSDAINFSDIESFFRKTLFSSEHTTVSLPSDTIKVALTGSYTAADIDALDRVCEILNSVASFVGIKEVLPSEADYTVNYGDDESFVIKYSQYGTVSGAEITVPHTLTEDERFALLSASLLRVCGFLNKCETTLDSALSVSEPAPYITDTDLLLLDILYSVGESGMSEQEFIDAVKNYF